MEHDIPAEASQPLDNQLRLFEVDEVPDLKLVPADANGSGSFEQIQPDQAPASASSSTAQPVQHHALALSEDGQPSFGATLLGLSLIEGLGRAGIAALSRHLHTSLQGVWKCEEHDLLSVLKAAKVPAVESVVKQILSKQEELVERGQAALENLKLKGAVVLAPAEFPRNLLVVSDAPPWLFVEGEPQALMQRPMVAIVGTREPSQLGITATLNIATLIAPYPITVVSGLADGIDENVHSSTLAHGMTNVAVLGHGVNHIFPKSTSHLRQQIVEQGGAVISEYLPHENYQKQYFVRRNRIQAALAEVVVPVESRVPSGTLHTVRFALKYDKPVIGLSWKGSNGLSDLLREEKQTVLEIFTAQGRRHFDGLMQQVCERAGQEPYPLQAVQDRIEREMQSRLVRTKDIEKLKAFLDGHIAEADLLNKPQLEVNDGNRS